MRSQILNIVGWSGSLLLAVIVLRMLRNGLTRRFPWFASYLAYVLVSSLVALWIYDAHLADGGNLCACMPSSSGCVRPIAIVEARCGVRFKVMRRKLAI